MRERIRRGRRRALVCALALGSPPRRAAHRPARRSNRSSAGALPAPAADDPGWPHDPGRRPRYHPRARRRPLLRRRLRRRLHHRLCRRRYRSRGDARRKFAPRPRPPPPPAITAVVATAASADDTGLPASARGAAVRPDPRRRPARQACPGSGCDGMSSGVFRPPEISIARSVLSTHHAAVTAGLARVDAKVAEAFLAEEATALLYAESRSCYATQSECEAACPCADWAHPASARATARAAFVDRLLLRHVTPRRATPAAPTPLPQRALPARTPRVDPAPTSSPCSTVCVRVRVFRYYSPLGPPNI